MFYNAETYKNHSCNEEQIRSIFQSKTLKPAPILINEDGLLITVYEYFSTNTEKNVKSNIEKITLGELDSMLDEEIPKLLYSGGITYIESQTACGKTERIIQWLVQQDLSQLKVIYSAPTYNTIDEFVARYKVAFDNYNKYTSLDREDYNIHTIPKGNYTKEDLLRLELGLPAKTRTSERVKAIQKLMGYENKGVYICTHQLLAHMREAKADLIIVDENIEDVLIRNVTLTQDGLQMLNAYVADQSKQVRHLEFINNVRDMKRGEAIDISPLKNLIGSPQFNSESYIESCKSHLVGLYKIFNEGIEARIGKEMDKNTIRFTIKSDLISYALENNIPVKLFSATPKPVFLSKYYNTPIENFKFPLAHNEGKVIQYRGTTGAKGYKCDKVPELINYVKEKLGEDIISKSYVLTFKDSIPE